MIFINSILDNFIPLTVWDRDSLQQKQKNKKNRIIGL